MDSKTRIIEVTIPILAREGYGNTSMRKIATDSGLDLSVIYYYFKDKEGLLREVRIHVTKSLDKKLHALRPASTAHDMLYQRVLFNLDEVEKIVCLLQYFMAVKQDFPAQKSGYVPSRASQHMQEVLERGIAEGVYTSKDPAFDAKIMTHLINGFLLEYYPHRIKPAEKKQLAERITAFIERAVGK